MLQQPCQGAVVTAPQPHPSFKFFFFFFTKALIKGQQLVVESLVSA